jgi:hypothetical protein
MEWFIVWWSELGIIGQVFAFFAIPMTVVMALQFILLIIGVGFGSDTDGDVEIDSDIENDFGTDNDATIGEVNPYADKSTREADSRSSSGILKIFTIRGIVAFFALGGWAGLAALSAGVHIFWVMQIALFAGVSALLLASLVIRLALKMQTSGNLNLCNAVTQTAEVYIRIPPVRADKGKVTMLLQERFVELDAVTDNENELLPGAKVDVVALAEKDCLLVSPAPEEKEKQ